MWRSAEYAQRMKCTPRVYSTYGLDIIDSPNVKIFYPSSYSLESRDRHRSGPPSCSYIPLISAKTHRICRQRLQKKKKSKKKILYNNFNQIESNSIFEIVDLFLLPCYTILSTLISKLSWVWGWAGGIRGGVRSQCMHVSRFQGKTYSNMCTNGPANSNLSTKGRCPCNWVPMQLDYRYRLYIA